MPQNHECVTFVTNACPHSRREILEPRMSHQAPLGADGDTRAMTTTVARATAASPELVEALARLIPQLTTSSPPPTLDELHALVESDTSTLLVATDDATGEIVGTLTLATFRIPTGVRAWIEDVVVDATARGQGVAELLTRHALELARAQGAASVELTSRPSREPANRLYRRIGFVERETNVYRFALE